MQDLSNVLFGLAKLSKGRSWKPTGRWLSLMKAQMIPNIHQMMPQQLSRIVWALSVLDDKPGKKVMRILLRQAKVCFQAFGADDMAMLLYGIVCLEYLVPSKVWLRAYLGRSSQLLTHGGSDRHSQVGSYKARALAWTAWSLAALEGGQYGQTGRHRGVVYTSWLYRYNVWRCGIIMRRTFQLGAALA